LFLIQQGCSTTGTSISWVLGTLWFLAALSLIVLAIWSWDRVASHHWIRKSVLTFFAVIVIGGLSYIPIARAYRVEHTAYTPEGAHINVFEIQVVPPTAYKTKFPYINIGYENTGKLPALSTRYAYTIWWSAVPLGYAEAEAQQDRLLKGVARITGFKREMYAGDKVYFALPDAGTPEAKLLPSMVPLVAAGKMFMYLFFGFEYRDRNTPDSNVIITEHCVYFFGDWQVIHGGCGRERTFLMEIKPDTPTPKN
jgi:hypothetical protein